MTAKGDQVALSEDVKKLEYYHGLMPRLDAEGTVKRDGDFILRKCETPKGVVLALSVRVNETTVKHFMINSCEDGFFIEGHTKKTVPDLINFYLSSKTPISQASGAVITTSVARSPWLITHDNITLIKKLGEGAFGEVYLAEVYQDEKKEEYAVKTMRQDASRDARAKFMKEARLMRKYQHPHIVRIAGVAVYEQPLIIVMEVCPNGSLLSYLRKNKGKTTNLDKLRFVTQAADGLSYLEKKMCIHRDIAARNCLLSAKLDVKISDFGMSDEKMLMLDKTADKLPVKWLPPEALQEKVYSSKTDIWSFGVLIWEVYADGKEPYEGMTNMTARAKVVVQQYRMKLEGSPPAALNEVVTKCWSVEPEQRGTMVETHKKINALYEEALKSK